VSLMARVLSGVVVKENRGFFIDMVAGKPEAVRVFRDKAVDYLAPLLVEGLTRAASDQQVGFRVVQTGTPAESTKGSLYAYGRSCRTYPRCFSTRWSSSQAKSTASAISRIDFRKSILCR